MCDLSGGLWNLIMIYECNFFSYTWQKNGKPYDWQVYDDRILQQPGRGTLVITSPRDEDIGKSADYYHYCLGTDHLFDDLLFTNSTTMLGVSHQNSRNFLGIFYGLK